MPKTVADVKFNDYSKKVLDALHDQVMKALVECGMKAHSYSVKLVPVDTGRLKNSIAFKVDPEELAMYIGSNCEYAAYVELGTGKYYPGGRDTPWGYEDEKGNVHWTRGNPAKPYLKPAVANHARQYRRIIEQELKNG